MFEISRSIAEVTRLKKMVPDRVEGIEAAYLALCRKGLKGHKPSLLEAIRIMLEVGPAVQKKAEEQRNKRQEILERLERMGVKIPEDAKRRQ